MSDNNSLNEKYQKFEFEKINTDEIEEQAKNQTQKKEKKKKEPKEKKVKEPKAPKEKKSKEKEPKPPKEKKVKEPKPPKEKKVKEPKPPKEPKNKKYFHKKSAEDNVSVQENDENSNINEKFVKAYEEALRSGETEKEPLAEGKLSAQENLSTEEKSVEEEKSLENQVPEKTEAPAKTGRQREEIVIEIEKTKKKKNKKAKKADKENLLKETKKKKPKKEKKKREPLQKKDFATIAVSVVAILLASCTGFFAYFNSRTDERKIEIVSKASFLGKIFPQYVVNPEEEGKAYEKYKLSDIQITRNGIYTNLMQTDFSGVFYGINSDYSVQYYQYKNNKIVPVKSTDSINLKVDMGSATLDVKMDYIKGDGYVSGIGVFTADKDKDANYFYDLVVFKLTTLPEQYRQDGHALLLATTSKSALETDNILWTESFDVNLNNGTSTRFLKVINRTIDERGAGVSDFCILNKAGYRTASQAVPFISSREYPVGSGMQDIFVKNGNKEELLASDVYGKYLTVSGDKIVYLRKTTTGFDVIHNTDGAEEVFRSFYGFVDSKYTVNDRYIFSKEDGRLYDIVDGKEYSLIGYSMNSNSFVVSGRYVVMMGTVKNAVDYQIHIFDLQTGEYVKFKDNNYAPHGTLCFIDDKTVLYTAVEPNQGYEYVILDIEKAFNLNK